MIKLSDYTYDLPQELIATVPAEPRDTARLMAVDRSQETITHHHFRDLPDLLRPDDVLVLNQTKVFPARLMGHKISGGKVELLLLEPVENTAWMALAKPGLKPGTEVTFEHNLTANVEYKNDATGEIRVRLSQSGPELITTLDKIGQTPIPPYIHSPHNENRLRREYQTVYAKGVGSAAAPTAGLHFTRRLLSQLQGEGIQLEFITLHVGLGTFKKLSPEQLASRRLHQERYEIDPDTAGRIMAAKKAGRRIVAVGTTTTRALESAWQAGELRPGTRTTDIFISPPYKFQVVDSLITNFHLPESSLLMMISAFTSHPNGPGKFSAFATSLAGKAYRVAIEGKYRFFSFGDAMFIS